MFGHCFEKIEAASRYTEAVFHLTRDNMVTPASWKVSGAFFNPNGISIKQKRLDSDVKVA